MSKPSRAELSHAELDVYSNDFSKESLSKLQLLYKTSSSVFTNLKPITIVVPVADRDKHLDNFLQSLEKELKIYMFPRTLLSVSIINDSKVDIPEDVYDHYSYPIDIRNLSQQINCIRAHYNEDLLKKAYWVFIKELPKNSFDNWERKGSWATMNIARLLINTKPNIDNNIIRFIDSDEEFSIMTKDKDKFRVIENPFSMLHSIQDIFHYYNADIVTGKITWDPAFSAPQMIRTQLVDLLMNSEEILPTNLYYHQNRAYNDMNFFSQDNITRHYNDWYPLLPFQEKWSTKKHPSFSILLWHHISRPICYSNPKKVLKNGTIDRNVKLGNILWPGNVAWNKKLLLYPAPFVESKVRLHGPILWKLMTKRWEKIHIANIPLLHRRIADIDDIINGYRWGTIHSKGLIDISKLWSKQIEWDIVAKYLSETVDLYTVDTTLLDEVKTSVLDIYKKQIADIKELLWHAKFLQDVDANFLKRSLIASIANISKNIKSNIEDSLMGILSLYRDYDKHLDNWQKLLDI